MCALTCLATASICTATSLQWLSIPQVRILYSVWILAVLILSHSYGGRFYSILAVPAFESPIDTVEDVIELARADRGFLVTIDHSSYLDTFLTSQADKGIYYLIGRHMARYRVWQCDADQLTSSLCVIIELDKKWSTWTRKR